MEDALQKLYYRDHLAHKAPGGDSLTSPRPFVAWSLRAAIRTLAQRLRLLNRDRSLDLKQVPETITAKSTRSLTEPVNNDYPEDVHSIYEPRISITHRQELGVCAVSN